MNQQSRPFRKPPDVEEALSSMLWTPYDNNASDTDSSLDDDRLAGPEDFGSASSSAHHHHHIQNNNNYLPSSSSSSSAAMKRSFSEWNYRSGKSTGPVHNRYSYPYGGYAGFHPGTMVVPAPLDPAATCSGVNGYWNGNNIYPNGSSYSGGSTGFFPSLLDSWKEHHRPVQVSVQTTTPLLPFSLLGVDTLPGSGPGAGSGTGGPFYEDDLINSNMMVGISDSISFGDYQVYPSTGSYLSPPVAAPLQPSSSCSSSSWSSSSGYNPTTTMNSDGYDNNNSSLCRISAMLKPVMRGHSGNVGDLHFSKHQQPPPPPNHSRSCSGGMENATSGEATDERRAADGRIRRSRSSADEWMKRNEQSDPFNGGYQYQRGGEFIAEEEGGCEGEDVVEAAVDGRATAIRAAPAAGSDRFGFSSVRIVNGEAYASDLVGYASSSSHSSESCRRSAFVDNGSSCNSSSRVRALQNLRGFGRSVRDRFVRDIMRLNVPAAPEGGSRTSVYIPSAEGTATTVESAVSLLSEGGGQTRPTLTIQVNRVDTNNQEQNDVVNNASSGVSIVNCYRRETPPKSDQENGQDRPQECQFYPSDVNSATTPIDNKNHVNISANAEQMVHVSNTAVVQQSVSSDPKEEPQKTTNPTQTIPQTTDIDRIEPATPNRTYTSTEAQTDLLDPQQPPYPQPIPYPSHPPPQLLLSPPGSEFSTREHRRRERRERRQARNRLAQHIHPIVDPTIRPPPPPPIELIPDILHSHLPPPYTTLPMGATAGGTGVGVAPAAVLHHPGPLLGPHHPAVAVAAAVHHRAGVVGVGAAEDCRYSFPIPIMRSSPSERSRKGCCGHWFAGPPLRALIAVVALGGVACALGGAALGATGLAGSPTSHLTAALLMIGVGVILVTVSGAAWRMTAPGAPPCLGLGSTVDLGRCSRRPCGRGGSTPHGLLYPEFQHRPPPPSYQASMQEYRLRLLLLDRDRQSGRMRSTASPPPTYRSNVGSLLRIPLTSRYNNNNSNPNGGGSTTSLFGGISGIINGAMGSSTNSINGGASPDHHHNHQLHPDPSVGGGVGAPPPTYRTIDRRSSTASLDQDQLQKSAADNAGTTPTTTSVIKIDDSKSTGDHSVASAGAGSGGVALVQHKQRNSITHDSIEADSSGGGGSNSSCKPDKPNQDLVTIVTISGTQQRGEGAVAPVNPAGKDGPL